MHNIAKGVNKKIHEAGKLVMMPLLPPDMGDLKEAREFLAEQAADIWFTADIGCFLNGLGTLMGLQRALVKDRTGGNTQASTGSEASDSKEHDESASDDDPKSKLDFVRTC